MSKLTIVGIGPGNFENMSFAAETAIKSCDVIVGYNVYVDLISKHFPGKEYVKTPMLREKERCCIALDLARKGKNVAFICSGDSGIYAMAALIYEIKGNSDAPEIYVVPGITAAISGASLLGAPINHDFAVISLSDRLTPWEKIEKRLAAAAAADFVIVLYNPSSKGRSGHLQRACEILLRYLPENRLCGIAGNIGRRGEERKILTLKELKDTKTDMSCTVFIGNSETKLINGNMITPRGYKNV